jgi:hypothetical protein
VSITIGSHGLVEDEIVWKVAAGADAWARFTLYDDVEHTVPTDLTGTTGACQVRKRAGGDLLADAVVMVGGPAGTVLVHLPASASRGWAASTRTAAFDVELIDATGEVMRLCTGALDIWPNITVEEI